MENFPKKIGTNPEGFEIHDYAEQEEISHEKKENKEGNLEFLKNKLSKAKNYILALAAFGYISQGVTGYNNAREEFEPKEFKEYAEGVAKVGFIYPVVESMEDVADFFHEQGKWNEPVKGRLIPINYDISSALKSGKSALEIAKENNDNTAYLQSLTKEQLEKLGGSKDNAEDFYKLSNYMTARAIAREYNLKSIE